MNKVQQTARGSAPIAWKVMTGQNDIEVKVLLATQRGANLKLTCIDTV